MRRSHALFLLLLIAGVTASPARAALAPERFRASAEGVSVEADEVEHFEREQRVRARGDVRIRLPGRSLLADEVELNLATETIRARGHVLLTEGLNRLEGEGLEYNYRENRGIVYQGKGFLAPATNLSGVEIRKVGDRVYRIVDARITACRICQPEPDAPDWEFRGRDVTLYQDDFAVAWLGTFWLRGVPVFGSPLAAFPVGPRRTGFLIPHVGYGDRDGFLYRQPFFWAIDESQDLTVNFGYRTSRGPEVSGIYRYVWGPQVEGEFTSRYLQDREIAGTRRARWEVLGRHTQRFTPSLDLRGELNLQSDREFRRDLIENSLAERTQRVITSTFFLTQAEPTYHALLSTDLARDLTNPSDANVARLPEVRFQLVPGRVGAFPLVYQADASGVNFKRTAGGVEAERADFHPGLAVPLSLTDWVTATTSASFRETAYSQRGDGGSGGTRRELFEVDQVLESRLGRQYVFDRWGFSRVTHTLVPRVGYQYIPVGSQRSLPQFDAQDFVSSQNRVTSGLTTALTVEQATGGRWGRWDLLTLDVRQSVNLSTREREFADTFLGSLTPEQVDQAVKEETVQPIGSGFSRATERDVSNIVTRASLTAIPPVSLRGIFAYNPEKRREDGTSVGLSLNYPPGFTAGLDYTWQRGRDVNSLLPSAVLRLFPGLTLNVGARVDLVLNRVREKDFTLRYDTCCWDAVLTVVSRLLSTGVTESAFQVRFELKTGGARR